MEKINLIFKNENFYFFKTHPGNKDMQAEERKEITRLYDDAEAYGSRIITNFYE
jgi:hypothetical protein